MPKRVFLIVLDSFGIGGAPDAADFGDSKSNTLAAIAGSAEFCAGNMGKLGLFNIDGVRCKPRESAPAGAFGRLAEQSRGKDTVIGHWEIAGVNSLKPLPVFPNGFPPELIAAFEARCGHKTLCNMPYSGTDVIRDYGEEQLKTGALIVYTSADSVFQIAANEAVIPLEELYRCCRVAREMLAGDWAVGRVIARPFCGGASGFTRTQSRRDYALPPPAPTVLDGLKQAGLQVIGVGKIHDIFAGRGITQKIHSANNAQGIDAVFQLVERPFCGLAFVNLVDFDMLYGHRNDINGYAAAISVFDRALGRLLPLLKAEDLLIITADHGCDPSTLSTDHSRECVPLLCAGAAVKPGVNLHSSAGFGAVANTVASYLGVPAVYSGDNFFNKIIGCPR